MQADPHEKAEPGGDRRGVLPWWFVVAGTLFLVVLAPLVPDEPMHLSGVMVVLGLASAVLAFVSGVASAIRSEASARRSSRRAAMCGLFLALGWLAWWVIQLMSQLG